MSQDELNKPVEAQTPQPGPKEEKKQKKQSKKPKKLECYFSNWLYVGNIAPWEYYRFALREDGEAELQIKLHNGMILALWHGKVREPKIVEEVEE